jgi:hypothetical protein
MQKLAHQNLHALLGIIAYHAYQLPSASHLDEE